MKTAIYSGSIPSTTFIENLIKGVAEEHEVMLFGKLRATVNYKSSNIRIYATPKNNVLNILLTSIRLLQLILIYPKRFLKLWQEVKTYHGWYKKWNLLSRFVPVILHKPDIFHIQWAKDIKLWVFLKTAFDIKLVLSLRGAHINYSPIADESLAEVYKRTFPKVDKFHAVSKAIALEAQKYRADKEKIEVIHSPIPKTTFDAFRIFKKNDRDAFHLVSVGRFHWKKGYKYAIDAVKLLKEQGVQVHYTIIASNTISEDILFQINQLGLENEITILKGLPQETLFKKVQRFDAVVLPSLEEGIANVVLEAMALGVPVISTDCGGMAEVVIPNKTGWLVPVRDPEALVQAIVEVSQTSELELQDFTKQAHEFVKSHFNAEDSISQFLELYSGVIN